MTTFLVSDDRERHVIGFIRTAFAEAKLEQMVRRINTGDYLVLRRLADGTVQVVAVIERKTLADYAASLRDGRHSNREKMLKARDAHNCHVFYIIEGPAFPSPTRKFNRIPFRSIQSSITNLAVRDHIHIIKTRNPMHTADRLADLVRAFAKLDEIEVPSSSGSVAELVGGATSGGADTTAVSAGSGADTTATTGGENLASGIPSEFTGPAKKSELRVATEMWARLSGISVVVAGVLARGPHSVADFTEGRAGDQQLKMPSGRAVHKRATAALKRLGRGERKDLVAIVSGVPGISAPAAASLLEAVPFGDMVGDCGIALLADAKLSHTSRGARLGQVRATRIWNQLNRRGAVPT